MGESIDGEGGAEPCEAIRDTKAGSQIGGIRENL